jgi:hypothetical protein
MLTTYTQKSDFKKKLTVAVIWIVALVLSFLLIKFIQLDTISLVAKIAPIIIGILIIAGILLRCKIARGFTLVILYFLALYPLITNLIVDSSFIFLSVEGNGTFTASEALFSNVIWALLFLFPLYFFSNNKAMEIFYIESKPVEHLFYLLSAVVLILLYIHFTAKPLLISLL